MLPSHPVLRVLTQRRAGADRTARSPVLRSLPWPWKPTAFTVASCPGPGSRRRFAARPALDLTEDTSILTAVGNDVGMDAVFARQVIAYGGAADGLVAFSTSGGSRNVLQALAEARRRGLYTVAFVGYDGGRIAAEGLADRIVLSPSQHISRIQEAQATAYHVLRTLMEHPGEAF